MGQSQVGRGVLIMAAAMLVLPAMDACAKLLSGIVSPGEVAFARLLLQSLMLLPFVYKEIQLSPRLWTHFLRGSLIGLATLFFFSSLTAMPLADALAIFFVEPLILTLLSPFFLGEKIGIHRIGACVIGFAGALLIIGPSGEKFGLIALLPLATAVCFAFYLIVTRRQRFSGESAAQMQFYSGAGGALFLAPVLLVGDSFGVEGLALSWPDQQAMGILLLLGLVSTVAHLLVTLAFGMAEASTLAPIQYLEIVSATLLGWVIFGDFPTLMTWAGIAVIIASGLYVYHREQIRSRTL